jgi:hypothetical protein
VGFSLSTGWNEFVCGPFVSFWEKKRRKTERNGWKIQSDDALTLGGSPALCVHLVAPIRLLSSRVSAAGRVCLLPTPFLFPVERRRRAAAGPLFYFYEAMA